MSDLGQSQSILKRTVVQLEAEAERLRQQLQNVREQNQRRGRQLERLREENAMLRANAYPPTARLHRIEEAVKEQFEFNEDGMTDALRAALEEEA